MKLSFDKIRELAVGAIKITEETDGIHFYRCTEKQTEAWLGQSTVLSDRSLTTCGVCLDFHTNSKNLEFNVVNGNKFDLYIDGVLRAQFKMNDYRERGEAARFSLCDGLGNEKNDIRVTIVFPSHEVGVLSYVELDDGAYATRHDFDRKMLFIGDSITQGWDSKYDSLSYAWRTTRHFNAETVNQGIGGAYFHEDCFDPLPFSPDAVIVAYGTNDFGHYHTYDEMRAHVSAHLKLIADEYKNAKIFVLSPIWRDKRDGKKMGTFENCRQIVIEEAEKLGLIHIDGLTLVPPSPEFFADEYLHPNDAGFGIYADNLTKALRKYI